jgi:phenylalanyl-tRNA synthetase beta subunit
MDSTFMGVVTGLSVATKKRGNKHLKLIHLSEKNKKLLVALGVDRVVDYSLFSDEEAFVFDSNASDQKSLNLEEQDKVDLAKTSLEAHVCLSKISSENEEKFRAVVEYLQDDVDNLDG